MGGAAHSAGMVGIIEADKESVETGFLVPPDHQHAIESPGGTIGMDFVNQSCPASGQPDLDNSVPLATIGKKFAAFHGLCRVPIAD